MISCHNIIARSNRLIKLTDPEYEVPPHMLEYSEDELRELLERNGHSPLGSYEIILDRAIRAFRKNMGDPNVRWAPEDEPDTRLRNKDSNKRVSERDNESVRLDNIWISSAGILRDLDPDNIINKIYQSEMFRLRVLSALQNTPAQFQTFFTNQSSVKNDTSIPDTVGSVAQPPDPSSSFSQVNIETGTLIEDLNCSSLNSPIQVRIGQGHFLLIKKSRAEKWMGP